MEGYLGQIETAALSLKDRVAVLERAAGESLAKARAEIADELYKAQHAGESPEVAAAKKAALDHDTEAAAKKAELDKAVADAVAKDEADKKAVEEVPAPPEPSPTQEESYA